MFVLVNTRKWFLFYLLLKLLLQFFPVNKWLKYKWFSFIAFFKVSPLCIDLEKEPSSSSSTFPSNSTRVSAEQEILDERTKRRKIEDEFAFFVSNGDYPQEEYMALIISLKEILKKKLILIKLSLDRSVINEEVIALQQQRIDLLQKCMAKYSLGSDGSTPRTYATDSVKSNLKHNLTTRHSSGPKKKSSKAQGSETAKLSSGTGKSIKTQKTAAAHIPAMTPGSVDIDNSQGITTDFVLFQHRFD